jgi:hypothetical protein
MGATEALMRGREAVWTLRPDYPPCANQSSTRIARSVFHRLGWPLPFPGSTRRRAVDDLARSCSQRPELPLMSRP